VNTKTPETPNLAAYTLPVPDSMSGESETVPSPKKDKAEIQGESKDIINDEKNLAEFEKTEESKIEQGDTSNTNEGEANEAPESKKAADEEMTTDKNEGEAKEAKVNIANTSKDDASARAKEKEEVKEQANAEGAKDSMDESVGDAASTAQDASPDAGTEVTEEESKKEGTEQGPIEAKEQESSAQGDAKDDSEKEETRIQGGEKGQISTQTDQKLETSQIEKSTSEGNPGERDKNEAEGKTADATETDGNNEVDKKAVEPVDQDELEEQNVEQESAGSNGEVGEKNSMGGKGLDDAEEEAVGPNIAESNDEAPEEKSRKEMGEEKIDGRRRHSEVLVNTSKDTNSKPESQEAVDKGKMRDQPEDEASGQEKVVATSVDGSHVEGKDQNADASFSADEGGNGGREIILQKESIVHKAEKHFVDGNQSTKQCVDSKQSNEDQEGEGGNDVSLEKESGVTEGKAETNTSITGTQSAEKVHRDSRNPEITGIRTNGTFVEDNTFDKPPSARKDLIQIQLNRYQSALQLNKKYSMDTAKLDYEVERMFSNSNVSTFETDERVENARSMKERQLKRRGAKRSVTKDSDLHGGPGGSGEKQERSGNLKTRDIPKLEQEIMQLDERLMSLGTHPEKKGSPVNRLSKASPTEVKGKRDVKKREGKNRKSSKMEGNSTGARLARMRTKAQSQPSSKTIASRFASNAKSKHKKKKSRPKSLESMQAAKLGHGAQGYPQPNIYDPYAAVRSGHQPQDMKSRHFSPQFQHMGMPQGAMFLQPPYRQQPISHVGPQGRMNTKWRVVQEDLKPGKQKGRKQHLQGMQQDPYSMIQLQQMQVVGRDSSRRYDIS